MREEGRDGRHTTYEAINVLLGGCNADAVGIRSVGVRGGFGHFVSGGSEASEGSRDHLEAKNRSEGRWWQAYVEIEYAMMDRIAQWRNQLKPRQLTRLASRFVEGLGAC